MTETVRKQEVSGCVSINSEFVSYSLNFEDVILRRLFPTSEHGFYVDVGAGHPQFENDMYALYLRGWRGINIEPNRGFHDLLIKDRPRDINLRVLVSDRAGEIVTYYEIDGSGLSTCDAELAKAYENSGRHVAHRKVPVTTLDAILTEAGVENINVLKVDVEGFEEKVLNGNDWDKFRPQVVVVETTCPESSVRGPPNIRGSMEQRGYRHVHFDGLNDFYLERNFPEPEALTLPPNVFDHFVSYQVVELRNQIESLRNSFTAAENHARSSKLETTHLRLEHDRLCKAAEQMRGELLVLSQFMEQLHATSEQVVLYQEKLAKVENELAVARARLTSAYSSRSWRVTAPLRWCNDTLRRLIVWPTKGSRG